MKKGPKDYLCNRCDLVSCSSCLGSLVKFLIFVKKKFQKTKYAPTVDLTSNMLVNPVTGSTPVELGCVQLVRKG